jgi:RNA polymerase sigma-70 factor, ECF subfamily
MATHRRLFSMSCSLVDDDTQLTGASADERDRAACDACDSFIDWLYDEYAGRLFAVILRFTRGDWQWAEDVVQETLVRAWRNAGRLSPERGAGSLMPWLATVARRIVINNLRGTDVRPDGTDETLLARLSVPDQTEHVLLGMVIKEALAKLTSAHRTVVVELYLRGRTIEEVADIVGVPPGTVKSRAYYALRAMRAALATREPAW